MKVGKEMDAEVEAKFFGYKFPENRCRICGWPLAESDRDGCVIDNCVLRQRPERMADEPRPFSTDLVEAFSVVKKLEELSCDFSLEKAGTLWHASITSHGGTGDTPMEAICRLALNTVYCHSSDTRITK